MESNEVATATSPDLLQVDGPDPRRWGILAVVIVAQLMIVLDASIVTIALPSAQHALDISTPNRQWVITAYTLAFGGFLLLGGRIADYWGRKRVFVVGLLGFAGASALGGLAVDQAMLFAARALQGGFAALMAPAALSILTITFQHDAKERAQAFGAYGAVSGAGGAIGVLLGGVLTEYVSWRWCLLVNVPIAVLASIAAVAVVHESRASGSTKYDVPGALLSTLGLVSLVYGFTKAESDGWSATITIVLLLVAVVLLAAFVFLETKTSHPLLPLRVVRDRNRGGAFLASLLTGAGLFAMFVFLSYYLQSVLHYSALKAGLAFLPFAFGIILAAGASSGLVPRIGPRIPMTVGLAIAAGGSGLADPDRGAERFLGARRAAGDPDECRTGLGLPGLQQHRPHPGPRSRTRAWPARWSTPRSRSVAHWVQRCSTPWRRPPPPATSSPTAQRPLRPASSMASPWPSRSVRASSHSERSPVRCSSPPGRPRSRRRRAWSPAQRADDP